MYSKALRRPGHAGRTTSQPTHARLERRLPRTQRPSPPVRLVGRWTAGSDGSLALAWALSDARDPAAEPDPPLSRATGSQPFTSWSQGRRRHEGVFVRMTSS
jgi:hypothetical protein